MFIPDPNFFHPGSRIRIKEFKYFFPKKCAFENMIRVVRPGLYFTAPGTRIEDPGQGVKKAPDPGSGTGKLQSMMITVIIY
jgi:hypothetical protein